MNKFKKALSEVLTSPVVWLSAIYMLFPADFIPDAIPVAGTVDDLIALVLVMLVGKLLDKKN